MNIEERIRSFSTLGAILRNELTGETGKHDALSTAGQNLNQLIEKQQFINPWFTPEYVRTALNAIAVELTEENLIRWTASYPLLNEEVTPSRVGVIMAGNIPLVGFHDFLSILISGNNIVAKTSSKDSELIVYLSEILCSINPEFRSKIRFISGTLSDLDMVIATGSDNSSRYFEYYFGKYPHIIRKNRKSIAIIDGNETADEIEALGRDIFTYFGLGCRNVSKIYIPEGYDLAAMAKNWDLYSNCINHQKYANNYDFNKAVFLVNREVFYDTGYILLKKESILSSPVSVLYYEYYDSQNVVEQLTEQLGEKIQCIVDNRNIAFGNSQSPHLWDYADGTDTLAFLLKKNLAGIL